jgi:hypothetical protein
MRAWVGRRPRVELIAGAPIIGPARIRRGTHEGIGVAEVTIPSPADAIVDR